MSASTSSPQTSKPTSGKAAGAARRPLYRREPWLAALMVAMLIGILALVLPGDARRVAALAAVGVGVAGVLLLLVHRPDPAADDAWKQIGSRDG